MAFTEEEAIEFINKLDKKVEDINLIKPTFDRPNDKLELKEPDVWPGIELGGGAISLILDRGLLFKINGIPIFQWEKGQGIGEALADSLSAASKELKKQFESKMKYEAVDFLQRKSSDFLEDIRKGKNNKSPVTNRETKAEELEFKTPSELYAKEEEIKTEDGMTIKKYPGSTENEDIEMNIDVQSRRQNQIRFTPEKQYGTLINNDLELPIVSDERAETLGLDKKSFMPFYFMDLRKSKQRCYFNAYLENISDTTSPNWSKEDYFGRTEGIAKYTNTEQTVSISFSIVCDWPQDINYVYKKTNWLKQNTYPSYIENNTNKIMDEPPLLRFRLGNLYNTKTGYITGLSYDYDLEAGWDVREGKKLPRKVDINIDFTILHEDMPFEKTEFYNGIEYDEDLTYYK